VVVAPAKAFLGFVLILAAILIAPVTHDGTTKVAFLFDRPKYSMLWEYPWPINKGIYAVQILVAVALAFVLITGNRKNK
jgi:hypothetical protein